MPLLLLDLDNTLLPRDAAFRSWARTFLAAEGLPPGDLEWLTVLDGSGFVPRQTVLGAVQRRYGLDAGVDALVARYRREIDTHIVLPEAHRSALRAARTAGWTVGVVSNGWTFAQVGKIRRTGLASLVDGWAVSEEAGHEKPDPELFRVAARRCGVEPVGDWTARTWMVGDHAPADIAGAEVTGLRSVWLHHGRPWPELHYRPTATAAGLPEAVGLVLASRTAPGRTAVAAAVAGRTRSMPGPASVRRTALAAVPEPAAVGSAG